MKKNNFFFYMVKTMLSFSGKKCILCIGRNLCNSHKFARRNLKFSDTKLRNLVFEEPIENFFVKVCFVVFVTKLLLLNV